MKDNARIKEFREEGIKMMIDDIKYAEKNGIDGDDLWEGIILDQYSYYNTEEDKIEAFRRAGYTVEID
jgi:predicted peroxiredoxin